MAAPGLGHHTQPYCDCCCCTYSLSAKPDLFVTVSDTGGTCTALNGLVITLTWSSIFQAWVNATGGTSGIYTIYNLNFSCGDSGWLLSYTVVKPLATPFNGAATAYATDCDPFTWSGTGTIDGVICVGDTLSFTVTI